MGRTWVVRSVSLMLVWLLAGTLAEAGSPRPRGTRPGQHGQAARIRPADVLGQRRSGHGAVAFPRHDHHLRGGGGPVPGGGHGHHHDWFGFSYPAYGFPICGWRVYGAAYGYWPYWTDPLLTWPPAPVVVPAGALFGPGALWRDLNAGNRAPPIRVVGHRPELVRTGAPERVANRRPRQANAVATARAWQIIDQGDAHFRKRNYARARQRFKAASAAAPDLAEAHFRQGHALLAMGQYAPAARAYKRGLRLKVDWAQGGFQWEQLYGDDRAAKQAHRDDLANAAAASPHNANLLLLLGIHLYFDGQANRARPFFRRAEQLVDDREHLEGFLADGAAAEHGREF